jgi:hypothetical protein
VATIACIVVDDMKKAWAVQAGPARSRLTLGGHGRATLGQPPGLWMLSGAARPEVKTAKARKVLQEQLTREPALSGLVDALTNMVGGEETAPHLAPLAWDQALDQVAAQIVEDCWGAEEGGGKEVDGPVRGAGGGAGQVPLHAKYVFSNAA